MQKIAVGTNYLKTRMTASITSEAQTRAYGIIEQMFNSHKGRKRKSKKFKLIEDRKSRNFHSVNKCLL